MYAADHFFFFFLQSYATVKQLKIFNGQTPNYLIDIFPPNVNARTQYTLRNANDIEI